MDTKNRFHTNETWLLMKAEHISLLVVLVVFVVMHIREINWGRFVFAFAIIDVIGYLPGTIAYHMSGGKRISPVYHYLYNVTHSYLTGGVVIALWAQLGGGFEWAMLAIPIHYSGDRGLFGNIYKPTSLPFEPVAQIREEVR